MPGSSLPPTGGRPRPRRRARIRALAALGTISVLLVVGAARMAGAQTEAPDLPVALELRGCAAIDERELRQLLAVEFATLGIRAGRAPERVIVQCRNETATLRIASEPAMASHGEMTVTAPRETTSLPSQTAPVPRETTPATHETRLDMTPTPAAARPRLLALAISEMVVEGRVGARRSMTIVASPAKPAAAPPASRETPHATPRIWLSAIGGVRRVGPDGPWLAGGGLGAEIALHRNVHIALDFGIEAGATRGPLAVVDWRYVHVAVHALLGGRLGPIDVFVGPGLRGGDLQIRATPAIANATGATVGGLWAGPVLALRAKWTLFRPAFMWAHAEAGYSAVPVVGLADSGETLAQANRDWEALSLGAGLSF